MKIYFALFLGLSICFSSCREEIQPAPTYYSGYISIGCDPGPYYLSIDSLIANCSSTEALPEVFEKVRLDSIYNRQLSLPNACLIDEMKNRLGNSTQFDLKLERGQSLLALSLTTNYNFTQIPLELDGNILSNPNTDYPYLAGYQIDLNPGSMRLFALNIWVGGCLHDMMVWEIKR
ncbi:MAG: hypothetical protein AAF696_06005 [Bacteroidota bacterium]